VWLKSLQEPEQVLENDLESGELERHLSKKSSKKQRLEPEKYPLMDMDKGLVGWENQDDPANPRSLHPPTYFGISINHIVL
jgi:hypothetical protein